jgi:hypothetical protein
MANERSEKDQIVEDAEIVLLSAAWIGLLFGCAAIVSLLGWA